MLLSLLTKDEKIYFIELVRKIILIDGEVSDVEKETESWNEGLW